MVRSSGSGATTTSSVVTSDVCFRAEAKLASTADMGAELPSTSGIRKSASDHTGVEPPFRQKPTLNSGLPA